MLFNGNKILEGRFARFKLAHTHIPYLAKATNGLGLEDKEGPLLLEFEVKGFPENGAFNLDRNLVDKLVQSSGVETRQELIGKEFIVYSRSRGCFMTGMGAGIQEADPSKLRIGYVNPVVDNQARYEIDQLGKMTFIFQKYCDRKIRPDGGIIGQDITAKDKGDYFVMKFNIYSNRYSESGCTDERARLKAKNAMGALGKLGIMEEVQAK